ncbi:piRNA biogenesis protein EXD1-like [Phlebotomus argentipes]|uniref:piRNA biogenesis protein EXD1-like n=1 Tax=Phlebotomus argentipes TaxID=94469 RepID=UPI00289347E1|nr:piRNA biogenesis protein EXD1-like [Phlebotomus argentipes]
MDYEELQKGQKVLLELDDKKICCEFESYNPGQQYVVFVNLADFNTKRHYARRATFQTREINRIHLFPDSQKEEDASSITSGNTGRSVVLTDEEIQVVQKALCEFTYIKQTDKVYFRAVEELKQCEKIALDVIGGRKGRFCPGSLLILATRESIYVIDLIYIGSIPCELKNILQARSPQKIIHDSCAVGDFLLSHKISLTNVSDTFIAHAAVTNTEKLVSVQECVLQHLKIPMTSVTDKDMLAFEHRPLTIEQCALAAEQVAFLHHLNTVLLDGNLFKRYYDACRAYKDGISQYDDSAFVAVRVGAQNYQEWIKKFQLF